MIEIIDGQVRLLVYPHHRHSSSPSPPRNPKSIMRGINDDDNNKSVGCGIRDSGNVVNCSDPTVLVAIQRFNARVFKSILFLEYGTPVNGSKGDECNVVWRFRNKREKS
ncbi:hypothetical protein Droror1_Dr00004422 [Drosera rotundifolia]